MGSKMWAEEEPDVPKISVEGEEHSDEGMREFTLRFTIGKRNDSLKKVTPIVSDTLKKVESEDLPNQTDTAIASSIAKLIIGGRLWREKANKPDESDTSKIAAVDSEPVKKLPGSPEHRESQLITRMAQEYVESVEQSLRKRLSEY